MTTVLGLNNRKIVKPYAYCKRKMVFLTVSDFSNKQCASKRCNDYQVLTGHEDLTQYETKRFSLEEYLNEKRENSYRQRIDNYERNLGIAKFSPVQELIKALEVDDLIEQ